jgi:hypothetical protein
VALFLIPFLLFVISCTKCYKALLIPKVKLSTVKSGDTSQLDRVYKQVLLTFQTYIKELYIFFQRMCVFNKVKQCQAIPLQAWTGPEGCRSLWFPEFLGSRHMKVVTLSALRTGRFCAPRSTSGCHLCWKLCRLQGHSAARKWKIPMTPFGNRTCDLQFCSVVPERTAPPHTPLLTKCILLIPNPDVISTGPINWFFFPWKYWGDFYKV